jgi:hypothetical protein
VSRLSAGEAIRIPSGIGAEALQFLESEGYLAAANKFQEALTFCVVVMGGVEVSVSPFDSARNKSSLRSGCHGNSKRNHRRRIQHMNKHVLLIAIGLVVVTVGWYAFRPELRAVLHQPFAQGQAGLKP